MLRVLAFFRRSVRTADDCGLAVFRGSLLLWWILAVLGSISGFCASGAASSGTIWPVDTARTASTRGTENTLSVPSGMGVHANYSWAICAPCVSIIACPLFCRKHSKMVSPVGVGANYSRWGQLKYLRVLGGIL